MQSHILLQFAFQLIGVLQNRLHTAKFLNQFLGRFLPHTGYPRDIVRCITPQTQNIDNLQRVLNFPTLQNFCHAQNLVAVTHSAGLINFDVFAHELTKILIGCHHENIKPQITRFPSQSSNDIIRLITIHRNHRDVETLYDSKNIRNTLPQIFRHLFALRLVSFKFDMSHRRCRRIKHNRNVGWLLLAQNFQ